MKRRFYTEYDIEFIRDCVLKDIPPIEISNMLHRTIGSIEKKIRTLGLIYPARIQRYMGRIYRLDAILKKRAYVSKIKKQENEYAESRLFAGNPNIGEKWQMALDYTGAKIIDFGGAKVYAINGKPTSIFRIMEIYQSSL